jgi:ABC-type multidrug transport system ATPase subunit
MIDAAVAVSGLTKVFPVPFHRQPIVAVRDLDLRVQAGEVYGLLGPKDQRIRETEPLNR